MEIKKYPPKKALCTKALAKSLKVKTDLNCVIKISFKLAAAPQSANKQDNNTNWNIGVLFK